MPQSPFAPAESVRQQWQFSIRGMLIFTLSVAIGASASQVNLSSWVAFISLDVYREHQIPNDIKTGFFGGMLAIVVFWFCFGLFHQIRDLRTWMIAYRRIDRKQRWGARFEMGWRVILLVLLMLYAWMVFLVDQKVLLLPEPGERFWNVALMIREALLVLFLLILVGSIPTARSKKWGVRLAYVLRAAIGIGILIFFIKNLLLNMCIAHLVEIAVFGIDNEHSRNFSVTDPFLWARYSRIFFWWAFTSGIVFGFNCFLLGKLASQWVGGIRRRCLWIGLLSLGIVNTSTFALWILAFGYSHLSVVFVETRGPILAHCWIALTGVMALLSGIVAYQMTGDWNETPEMRSDFCSWRQNAGKYYHEWRLVLLFLAVAIIGLLSELFYYQSTIPGLSFSNIEGISRRRAPGVSFDLIPVWLNGRPINYLWLGLLLLTIHRILAWRNKTTTLQPEIPGIDLAQFLTVWLLTFAAVYSGMFALAWMGFAVWYNPWYARL